MGIENRAVENYNLDRIEGEVEGENFTYDLAHIFEAAGELQDLEVREYILNECEKLRGQILKYFGFVLGSFERRDDAFNASRSKAHNELMETLELVTRNIGPSFRQWHEDPPSKGGLGGEEQRERKGAWATREGLTLLRWQHEREDAEYESKGSTAYAA